MRGTEMRGSRQHDRGFALVFMAFVMVAMVGAVTVAVDLGSRYAEAAKIQRASDAAALAGVTVLPQGLSIAVTEARQVAARNGYQHGVDGVTVDVTQNGAEVVEVRIQDADVPEFFAGMFSGKKSITRVATAKYVRAISLGSPRNFLGTGDLLGHDQGGDMRRLADRSVTQTSGLRENYWLAINGMCSSKENGDRFNAITDANYGNDHSNPRGAYESASPFKCTAGNTVANHEYRDYGYLYAVTVPPAYDEGNLDIQVYDPSVCNNSRPGDSTSGGMNTTFTVRTGSTDPLGGTVVASRFFVPAHHGCNSWSSITTVTPPVGGATYYIQVEAGENHNPGPMSNGFALRASVASENDYGRFWGCSSDPIETDLYSPKCPQVFAVSDMGVFASLTGSTAEFFLAEVGPEYNGKQLEVTLFDPGEGAETLRIKDPAGDYATFDWEVDCGPGVVDPTGGCSGTNDDELDLIGDTVDNCFDGRDVDTGGGPGADRCAFNPQPGPRRASRWKYNDRSLTLTVDLPADIGDEYGGATWWKIEYTTNTAPTDRTTWSVQVKGDPVRLIPNE